MASDPPPPSPHQTHIPIFTSAGVSLQDDCSHSSVVPIHIVTHSSQLPPEFLDPSDERQLVIGFDCEGVDLCRYGSLCVMQALYFQFDVKLHNVFDTQIAYNLIEEQEGNRRRPDDYISFVGLLADPRYCGTSYIEKEEVRVLLRQDPNFWKYRPMSELMVRTAADDVRFLLYIYHKMMEKLNKTSLWHLMVRGSLYCRCFCVHDNEFSDWPSLPPPPDCLAAEGDTPEEVILSVLNVPPGKMGRVIGRKGAAIMSVKRSCNAEILMGGSKGPPDKVFIIGPVNQVRRAEAIIRGQMLDL